MTFITSKIEVSKKEAVAGKNEYVKVGEVAIHVPTLQDIIDAGTPTAEVDDKGAALLTDDGLPVYKADAHNWAMNAIFAQVKAQARNKLVSGTATLKPGAVIATDWPTLTAEGTNTGEALAIVREAKQAMAAWAASLGKSAGAQALINGMFGNKQALALQSDANKAKIEAYIMDFAASLDEAKQARFERYITSVIEVCTAKADSLDDF
jgi:hypothetical protein